MDLKMVWFRKFAAIVLLSVGAGMVYLPWPAHLAGERTREVVRLEVRPAPFTRESARARFSGSFIELSYEGMDGSPGVRDVVLDLMGRSGYRCVPSKEWQALLVNRSAADPDGLIYSFRDSLYRIESVEERDSGPEGALVCFEATMLGAYDNPDWAPMVRLEAGILDGYPELKAELERLATGPLPAQSMQSISPRQWRRFVGRELGDSDYLSSFVAMDRLCSGWVGDAVAPWSLQTPWLRQTAGVIGAAVAFLGLLMAITSYRTSSARPGIPVSSPWFVVFCDFISLGGGSIFIVVAIDTLWVGPLGQPSLLGLKPEWLSSTPITGLHFISVPVVLIVLPLLTLWFTSLSAQRIQVDDRQVTSHGALGSVSISWQDLEQVHVREQKNPFAFTVVDFRSLQKVVELEGGEHSITINEPGSRKRKAEILKALRRHVPEAKRTLISSLDLEW